MSRGVLYVAYGSAAKRECILSIISLCERNSLSVHVITDEPIAKLSCIILKQPQEMNRLAKIRVLELSPYTDTLYLDADTRIRGDLSNGFEVLEKGWDLAIVPGFNQVGKDWLWHCGADDREATLSDVGYLSLVLGGGVWFVRRGIRTMAFFSAWQREWDRYKGEDQGALLRALSRVPLHVWLLGTPWNGNRGTVVDHRYGMARRSA